MDERIGIQEAPPTLWRRFWARLNEPFPDPDANVRLQQRLNPRSGERVLRVVPKHPCVYLPAVLALGFSLIVLVVMFFATNPAWQVLWWLSLLGVIFFGARAFLEWRDVFVVTNWRVVRLSGFFTARVATMPVNRILDMTMTRPPLGRVLGYGHFVFESAAQEQGLREIKYVPKILDVDHEINNAVRAEGKRRAKIVAKSQRQKMGEEELTQTVEQTERFDQL